MNALGHESNHVSLASAAEDFDAAWADPVVEDAGGLFLGNPESPRCLIPIHGRGQTLSQSLMETEQNT